MRTTFFAGTILCLSLLGRLSAQEVQIMREAAVIKETAVSSDEYVDAEASSDQMVSIPVERPPAAPVGPKIPSSPVSSAATRTQKSDAEHPVAATTPPAEPIGTAAATAEANTPPTIAKQTALTATAKPAPAKATQTATVDVSTKPVVAQKAVAPKLTVEEMRRGGELAADRLKKETAAAAPATAPLVKPAVAIVRPMERAIREPEPQAQLATFSGATAFIRLADGFDFPVGRPDAKGYYRARGFRTNGHLGEDWDGVGGGDTDLGDPINCIGDGVVVFARDCHMGWGNVIIVRHAYREDGVTRNIDSLYGHLQKIMVRPGQKVRRGEQIATLGNAHGLYDAHLHLEIRKNIEIGMSRAKFAQDYSNYFDPSQFILTHRHLSGGSSYRVAMNTFSHDARIPWDKLRNYSHSHSGGGSGESAVALKKALASQTSQ